MHKRTLLSRLLLAAVLVPGSAALAQTSNALHVVRSTVNAESENAELCLEFDKTLAPAAPARLASALRLEADGKSVTPANIAATGMSLCLFPLERGKPYHLDVAGLRSADDEKMASPYKLSFTIPDRSPSLAFTGKNGGVNVFGSYDNPLTLRAVNVARAKIEVYRLTDSAQMAHVWQDRAQTSLAPSESAYLARNKGQPILRDEKIFDSPANATVTQEISLSEKMPDLAPGLYLIIADAGYGSANSADKGLAPLAAAWFTKSDFSLSAVRDSEGIHVFAAKTDASGVKGDIHLSAVNRQDEQLAESTVAADGIGLIAYPPKLADKNDIASVTGLDPAGNVAFADIENLPTLSSHPALGTIHTGRLFAAPMENVDVSLSLAPAENPEAPPAPSVLRLSQGETTYADFPVPATQANAKVAFPAPAPLGLWNLHWQKQDGTLLATAPLRITANADAPHLEVTSERDSLTSDGVLPVTIKSVSDSGKPAPLTGGHIRLSWQKLDPGAFGWKDYHFGIPTAILGASTPVADFVTDPQGTAQLRLALPARPTERGLYQASLEVTAEADAGVADAPPLVLPLHPEATVIGIKPLAAEARFTQNGLARFALVGLSTDGKPRDVSGISYQVYEEGRSFDWYQDEGRWKYKPEPQLRPIGGGALTIKADASSILEWPVTAGNYRLEILDQNGKALAQLPFSASWDSTGAAAAPVSPLTISLPKNLQAGHEVLAHVTLPEASLLTAIIADTRIRKIVHEFRAKGDNTISFTPDADWQNRLSVTIEATPQDTQKKGAQKKDMLPLRASIEADLAQGKPIEGEPAPTSLVATDNPSALVLRKDGAATLTFGIQNNGDAAETYHYAFTAATGLKLDAGASGDIALNGKQSRALSLSVSGLQQGNKDLRLEVSGAHTPRLNHSWTIAVLPPQDSLRSAQTLSVGPQQALLPAAKPHNSGEETLAFVSRNSMNGLAEILSYVFNSPSFTTEEVALKLDVLRLWSGPLSQTGMAPDFVLAAQRQEQFAQLLRHQNADGGFGSYRGEESTLEDTASALTALGSETSEQTRPAKILAVNWLKQRLANTWVDEKERAPRAAAYAALATADAVDPASLHYFSDTSATGILPPLAEAHIAAAFKHIHEPDAAAFWIKKMLDENPAPKSIQLLNALAATDALSSDEVLAAMTDTANILRHGNAPELKDAAALLRAVAATNSTTGTARLTNGKETRDISGVFVLRGSDATAASYRNGDARPLSVTLLATAASEPAALPAGAALARHIYRLNGVELLSPAKPVRGEIYMIEIKGAVPSVSEGEQILVQDGGTNALRPMGCPLSPKLDTLSFIPWFTTRNLTPVNTCEFSTRELNVILAPTEDALFSVVTFAHIDAQSATDIPPPRLRVLK